jgi:MFS family permease
LSLLGALLITKLFDVMKYDFAEDHEVIEKPHKHHKSQWWRQVLLIGSLIFVCYLSEGAIADWSAIYMKSAHGVNPFMAVLAYMIFNGCMTIGRLTGDLVIRRIGARPTLIAGGMMGVFGLSLGLLSPSITFALVGFGIIGLGLSVLVPILISMAGSLPGGDRNVAIARVSTCGSIGLMAGPAAIGFVADGYSLLAAMLIPVALLAGLSVVAMLMHKAARTKYDPSEVLS